MKSILSVIQDKLDYVGSNGRNESAIAQAEKLLNNYFAVDYREYLLKIGLASFDEFHQAFV